MFNILFVNFNRDANREVSFASWIGRKERLNAMFCHGSPCEVLRGHGRQPCLAPLLLWLSPMPRTGHALALSLLKFTNIFYQYTTLASTSLFECIKYLLLHYFTIPTYLSHRCATSTTATASGTCSAFHISEILISNSVRSSMTMVISALSTEWVRTPVTFSVDNFLSFSVSSTLISHIHVEDKVVHWFFDVLGLHKQTSLRKNCNWIWKIRCSARSVNEIIPSLR